MLVSVVIPTCNRPDRLRALLENLNRSTLPLHEVLVVDSSDRRLGPEAFAGLDRLSVVNLEAARSVCAQRNAGIRVACKTCRICVGAWPPFPAVLAIRAHRRR